LEVWFVPRISNGLGKLEDLKAKVILRFRPSFISLEESSLWRRIFIGSHSLGQLWRLSSCGLMWPEARDASKSTKLHMPTIFKDSRKKFKNYRESSRKIS
jgi:hypothetical protein